MAAVTVAAVAKKVAAALASNKKGRKIIGYVIGISVFIFLIPVLVVFCLFGWTSGNVSEQFDSEFAIAGISHSLLESDEAIQERFENIRTVFSGYCLPEEDINKAQFLSIKTLAGMEEQDNFYKRLASCFTETTLEKTVYDLIEETFGIYISDTDKTRLDELYGVTPARKSNGGGR